MHTYAYNITAICLRKHETYRPDGFQSKPDLNANGIVYVSKEAQKLHLLSMRTELKVETRTQYIIIALCLHVHQLTVLHCGNCAIIVCVGLQSGKRHKCNEGLTAPGLGLSKEMCVCVCLHLHSVVCAICTETSLRYAESFSRQIARHSHKIFCKVHGYA